MAMDRAIWWTPVLKTNSWRKKAAFVFSVRNTACSAVTVTLRLGVPGQGRDSATTM